MGFLSRAVDRTTNNVVSTFSKRWHPAKWPKNRKDLEAWLITGKYKDADLNIDEDDVLGVTAIWSAMLQLSTHPASLPLHLYQSIDRGKKKAVNHYQYNMLHLKPNPYMETMSFREALMCQILRYGYCCAEKVFDGAGRVRQLWPLLSNHVDIDVIDNKIWYTITLPDQTTRILPYENVLKINGFSPDGILGFNPITHCVRSIALSKSLEDYGLKFFTNGARPSAVLEHPASLSLEAQDRLRKNWNKIHQGLDNSHRIAILEEGMKLKEFSVNPENAQTLETRKFQIEEIARIFNMPVHMLKNLDRATNNNIEFQGQEYVTYTLTPWLIKFEQAYTAQLLTEKEQKKYFYKHKVDGLLRGDPEKRHKTYAIGRQWGYYSANNILEKEDENTIGPQGDVYLIPMNMTPADRINDVIDSNINKSDNKNDKDNNSDDNDSDDKKQLIRSRFLNDKKIQDINIVRGRIHNSYIIIFQDAIKRILNRESLSVQRAFKKDKDILDMWFDTNYKNHEEYVRKIISPSVLNFVRQIAHQAYDEIIVDEELRNIDLNEITKFVIDRYIKNHISFSRSYFESLYNKNSENINDEIVSWIDDISYKFAIRSIVDISNTVCSYIFNEYGYQLFIRTVKFDACDECKNINSTVLNSDDIKTFNGCCCIITI